MTQTEDTPNPDGGKIFRVEVTLYPTAVELKNNKLVSAAHQLGVTTLNTCSVGRLFFLQGNLTLSDVTQITERLLVDPVTEAFVVAEQMDGEGQEEETSSSLPPHSHMRQLKQSKTFPVATRPPSIPPVGHGILIPPR